MHHLPPHIIEKQLGTNLNVGLSNDEAVQRLQKYGPNSIQEVNEVPGFLILLRQFKGPIVYLLLLASVLSGIYQKWSDVVAILAVLIINAVIGFLMEFKADRSMNALKKLGSTQAKVVRGGILQEVESRNIVVGDVIFIEAGDLVSADARIFHSVQFQVDESALTGESVPVEKTEKVLSMNTPLADQENMIFKGTFVTRGNARAVVVATAMETKLGRIALLVSGSGDATTPIEKKLSEFSKKLIWITLLICLIIFITGIIRGNAVVDMLNTVIALFVAAIPEGLPVVATLALAHGMMKMAGRNVIVKKLASVETLGGTNVICTDKTGTLTYNKISVSHFLTSDFNSLFHQEHTHSAQQMLRAFILCNNATIEDGTGKEIGDPLETGLLLFADKLSNMNALRIAFPKIGEEPFRSETKWMATLHAHDGEKILFAKGAAEVIISMSSQYLEGDEQRTFTPELKKQWLERSVEEASRGLKVLAFAIASPRHEELLNIRGKLTFLGLVALMDPPRSDVPQAIRLCHDAGIKVVMITGDHPSTARNIAAQVGIIAADNRAQVIEGSAMKPYNKLTAENKLEWKSAKVFARVSPEQKLDLVRVMQEDGHVVAMTGDGVNDAPALKQADIGIAMGLRGTEVAKEVAHMILRDDSFSSIVAAVREGRTIFENIRKFLMFLLSGNLSEILIVAFLFLTGSALSFVPLQILFINLLTDVFPALALAFTRGSRNLMNKPPRDPSKPVLNNLQWITVVVYAAVIATSSLCTVIVMTDESPATSSTVLFYTLILSLLLHVFNVGDQQEPIFKTEIIRNIYVWLGIILSALFAVGVYFIPPARSILHLGEIKTFHLITIAAGASLSLVVIQVLKKSKLIY